MRAMICSIVVIGIVAGFIKWSNNHLERINKAAESYETCVWSQYHMSPINYYQEHGAYPECN